MGTRGNNYKILLTYTCLKTDYVVSGPYTVFKKRVNNGQEMPLTMAIIIL